MSLLGHKNILEVLEQTVKDNRVAHAYLFTGCDGIGKKQVALRFACMLNCLDSSNDTNSDCPACKKILSEKHPDVSITRPEKGIIRIERIRELQSSFKYAPIEGRWRVCIIDDAHCMNQAAQNALLKTLEEPPLSRILILISAQPNLLLSTVRSRCRRIRFGSISKDLIIEILKHKGISLEDAQILAACSGGSIGKALEMSRSNYVELRERIITMLFESSKEKISSILAFSSSVSSDRTKATQALDAAREVIRDILVSQSRPDSSLGQQSLDRIEIAAQHHSSDQLIAAYEELAKGYELIQSEFNVNPNLITDVTLLKVIRILAGPNLGIVAE